MTTLVQLVAQARRAGLTLTSSPDGKLIIRGPRTADAIAQALLARKADVLHTIHVYNGTAPRLDWRRGRVLDEPGRCILCGRNTLFVDPYDGKPMHKSCAEAAIRWGTEAAKGSGKGWAA